MIGLFFAFVAFAQDPLPSIVDQYVTDFRNDFDVRDQNRQDYRPLLANVVRLAFHSCVGNGGCDGCINMNQADNAGLELSVNYLEAKTSAWLASGLSKADLYALAHIVAANMALGNAGWESDLSNFEIGRTDCTANTDDEFPDAHGSPFQFFEDNFGFTPRDTTVIFGAHTLGRALPGNSGFVNFWSDNALELGNGFYEAIERNPWRQINLGGGLFQWDQNRRGNPNLMALNADMFLVRDLNPDGNGRETQCLQNFNDCDDADTLPIVEFFTTNAGEDAFQQEFKEVYLRMIRSAGQGFEQDLQLICNVYDCSTIAPASTTSTQTTTTQTATTSTTTSTQVATTSSTTASTPTSTTDRDDSSDDSGRPGRDDDERESTTLSTTSSPNIAESVLNSTDAGSSNDAAIGQAIGISIGVFVFLLILAFCWFYLAPTFSVKASETCDAWWKSTKRGDPESPSAPISPRKKHDFAYPAPSAPVANASSGERRPSYWRNFHANAKQTVLPKAPSVASIASKFEGISKKPIPPPLPIKPVEWYYANSGGDSSGPFSDAFFKSKIGLDIKKDTYVWNGEDFHDWTLANDVPELKSIFVKNIARSPRKLRSRPFAVARKAAFASKHEQSKKQTSVSDLIARFGDK